MGRSAEGDGCGSSKRSRQRSCQVQQQRASPTTPHLAAGRTLVVSPPQTGTPSDRTGDHPIPLGDAERSPRGSKKPRGHARGDSTDTTGIGYRRQQVTPVMGQGDLVRRDAITPGSRTGHTVEVPDWQAAGTSSPQSGTSTIRHPRFRRCSLTASAIPVEQSQLASEEELPMGPQCFIRGRTGTLSAPRRKPLSAPS